MHILKGEFLNIYIFFSHPQIPDFKIVGSRSNVVLPYINGKLICSAFRLCIHFNKKMTLVTGFVVQGHIFQNVLHHLLVTPTDTFFHIFAINKYSFSLQSL